MTSISTRYKNFIKSKDEILKDHNKILDADFGRALETTRLGIHWIELPPHQKSSNPHAESLEEEFVYVVSGRPHVWINGYIYQLEPGVCVGFPAGTGIAHTFINNSIDTVVMIVLGDRTKEENKCSFPINPELKEEYKNIWWDNYPKQIFGPHDGSIGNLQYQKSWQELPFIKNISTPERKEGFSYPTDTEKFTLGLRLTDLVGLKSLGVWHEIMPSGKRSSWPHAHKIEEEAAILIKGKAKIWINGFIYEINPGDCVFFKPGTGIAHVILNDGPDELEFLGIGQADGGGTEDKVFYPLHQTRNEQCVAGDYFWNDCPKQIEFGSDFGIPKQNSIYLKSESSVSAFLQAAESKLMEREAEYSLLIGVCELIKAANKNSDEHSYITVYKDNQLIGGLCVSERNVIISAFEEPVIKNITDFLKEKKLSFPGVFGPALTSEAFARIWSQSTNQSYKLAMGQKIYKLDTVTIPNNIPGKFSLASEEQTALVGKWIFEFSAESLPHEPTTIEKTTKYAVTKIKNQEIYLWLDEKNEPVSMNLVGRPTRNGISVSGVYTPKHLRKKGYATAVVAYTSQKMLDLGKNFCVLYTDVANPTSNKIYQKIGYREIATSKHFIFVKE